MLANSYEITVAGPAAGFGAPETDVATWRCRHHSHRLGKLWGKDNARYQATSPGLESPLRNGWRDRIRCSWGPITAA